MAFVVVAAGVAFVYVAPLVVTGISYRIAYNMLGHEEVLVQNRSEDLVAGAHISYKTENGSRRHAIVVRDAGNDYNDPVKLVYWQNGREDPVVVCEEVRLPVGDDNPIYIHRFNDHVAHNREIVEARVTSLYVTNASGEHQMVICKCWRCFASDEDFAIWCHTGLHVRQLLNGKFSTEYKYTRIQSIGGLRLGDHVWFGSRHGIVVELNVPDRVVRVAYKMPDVDCPSVATLQGSDYLAADGGHRKLFRYDYDIALGHSGETVAQTALNETDPMTRGGTPPPYWDDESFAVWCKLFVTISPRDASTLAKTRVASRLNVAVRSVSELHPGDHVTFFGKHLIVENVVLAETKTHLDVVWMPNGSRRQRVERRTFENIDLIIRNENLEKFFYDIVEIDDVYRQKVLRRALEHVNRKVDELPFKDAQHFAFWCCTGLYQVHSIR